MPIFRKVSRIFQVASNCCCVVACCWLLLTRKMKAVDPAIRGRIIGMCEGGLSKAHIARECGVSPRTVFRFWKQYQEDPNKNIPVKKQRQGRAERATLGDIRRIQKIVKKHPFWSARAIRDSHRHLRGLPVHTVQNVLLKKLRLKAWRAANKPPLSDKMLAARRR